MYMLSTLQFMV